MEELLLEIIDALKRGEELTSRQLSRVIDEHNRIAGDAQRRYAKKKMLPYYLRVKSEEPQRWERWGVDDELEKRLFSLLRMKPRRSASGVATITVITPPWPCAGNCLYCPNDIRMPKSYLHDEPACQRAERNFFDPYLQVSTRLHALVQMGHPCDKVELIVLGGSWTDYPRAYQAWFMAELFRALNDADEDKARQALRRRAYLVAGFTNDPVIIAAGAEELQREVTGGSLTYNEALECRDARSRLCVGAVADEDAQLTELEIAQRANEDAPCRCVGLVVETRPGAITPQTLYALRRYGCTKVQIGVQSLQERVLAANGREAGPEQIARAFALLRLFGFKIHAHFMCNLLGSDPAADVRDFELFASDARFMPDEVKLYPCALIESSRLSDAFKAGAWRPYAHEELVGVLSRCLRATPPFTRVSRVIRDFSATDIVAGNKLTNLRQLVEQRLGSEAAPVHEIRYREIGTRDIDGEELVLDEVAYDTSISSEHFLQWVTPEGRIAGFLRLSLPRVFEFEGFDALPCKNGEAMIREVHVYGAAAKLHQSTRGAQHRGLGSGLVFRALDIARAAGFARVHVISAVGTRAYYRKLGFFDNGLYQSIDIE